MMQQLNSNRIAPGLHDLCIKRIGKIERARQPELHRRDIYSVKIQLRERGGLLRGSI